MKSCTSGAPKVARAVRPCGRRAIRSVMRSIRHSRIRCARPMRDSVPDGHVRCLAPAVSGTAVSELDGLLDLAGLEAARADIGTLRLAVQDHPHALEVRVEAPLRRDHRMAPMVAETGLFPTD